MSVPKNLPQSDTDNRAKAKALIAATFAVSEAIKDLGKVPNGHLYAQLMPYMSFETYTAIISVLKDSGVVAENNHMLTWVGKKD
jgi:hypothetical protein